MIYQRALCTTGRNCLGLWNRGSNLQSTAIPGDCNKHSITVLAKHYINVIPNTFYTKIVHVYMQVHVNAVDHNIYCVDIDNKLHCLANNIFF